MPIQFPEVEEVRLDRPPLDEVVCQVRFPSILRIAQEEPAAFQDLIRKRFPGFEKQHSFQLKLSMPGNPADASAEVRPITYLFTDGQGQNQAVLSPSFYAVSIKRYGGWQVFLKDLELVHSAVMEVYEPAYATRVGLRYINRMTPENTGTTTRKELIELVRAELTSTLRGQIWENVEGTLGLANFVAPPAQLNLRYGLDTDDSTWSFLLDLDYFEEGQIDLAEALARCEQYHETIYRAFRWMVNDETLGRFGGGAT